MLNLAYRAATVTYVFVICLVIGRITHLSWFAIAAFTLVISGYLLLTNPLSAEPPNQTLSVTLETIRAKYKLPALGGAIFSTDGLVNLAAVGVRKSGDPTPVTKDDLWHLGSDTKVMTAALAGTFVTEKKLSWNDKILSFFPDLAAQIPEPMRNITVSDVLSHRAGLKENLDWSTLSKTGTLSEQRLAAVKVALTAPAFPVGTFHYSNTDYVIIGAILEKIGGKPWEELIQERIFKPLGMTSAGFGGLGTVGQVDQPWPHLESGQPLPVNGPLADNPEIMGPAGTVHCTMTDWSKFLVNQLRGSAGMKAQFPSEIYQAMQAAPPKADYGYGWIIVDRSWAGGKALSHAGSNTLNFCVVWLAPAKKFGVLVCTNQGGANSQKATDEAASAMIRAYLKKP